MNAVARALKIRTGEARLAASMIALSFLVMAGQAIGQSGVTGLFFERIGTDALPSVYLLQGGSALAVMLVMAAVLGRVDQRRAFLTMGGALAIIVLAERVAMIRASGWIYWVLWLTVALAVLVQTVFVWGIAGMVTDTRQAKRLFPLFAAGGILGSVVGGLLTAPLVGLIGSPDLLLVWVGTLVGATVLGRNALSSRRAGQSPAARPSRSSVVRDLSSALRYVTRSRLLVWMTLAAILFSVLFFSLFLPWAAAAAERYPGADELARFFGLFSAVTTAAAFLVSMLAANRVFGRFGIAAAVMILPLLYVGSFGVLLVTSSFAALVAVRAATGIWLQGVASPGWEALTNVVPDARRDQVRAFLNGGPAQAGTAIAGLIALVGSDVLSARQLTIVGLVTAALTVFVTWRIKHSYASALVDALRAGRPVFSDAPSTRAPFELDHDAQALQSVLDATEDPSPAVRRLAVGSLVVVDDDRARACIERALRDPDAVVAASAAAALAGRSDDPGAEARLRALVADPDAEVRAATVAYLGQAPAAIGASLAAEALSDRSPMVRAAAVLTLASLDPDRALGPAIGLLEDPSHRVREAAAEASVRIGAASVDPLLAAMARPTARRASLEALAQLDLGDRHEVVRTFFTEYAAEASHDRALAVSVASDGEAADLVRDALLDRARRTGRTALRALSLISADGPSMRAAIDSLDARDGVQVANALETLDSTADPVLVRPLLPLWERSDPGPAGVQIQPLDQILHDPDPFIAMCGELLRIAPRGDDEMAHVHTTMPMMERVLFLRKVPLFDELAPADLLPIAEVAEGRTFTDGELLAVQGEMGDGLHVIVTGSVGVEAAGAEIARRGPGDVVGEMSLITQRPRMASLIAGGDVRTIWISRRAFEGMIHDRPDVAIGVMRVLADRLGER